MSTVCKGLRMGYKTERAIKGSRYEVVEKQCIYCSLYALGDTACYSYCGTRVQSKSKHRTSGAN